MKRAIILALWIVGCASVCPHADPSLSLWSDTTEWNQANAAVVIPANTAVKLDVGDLPKLESIEVSGTLVFDNIDLNLDLNWLKVNSGGKLIMGSTEGGCSITNKIVVTFYGPRDLDASPMGNDPGDGTVLGSKGMAVAAGGTIEIHGMVSGKSWTRLSKSVDAGSKVLYLQDSVSWQAGDQIVIASTDFGPITDYADLDDYPSIDWLAGIGFPEQTEVGTIESVSGNTVHLVKALNYSHYGVDYESAEIGLLTRKIVFRGDDDSLNNGFGAHLILRQAKAIHIEGAEFTRSGQQGLLGRYPVHFHLLRDVSNSGFYVKDCSIHDNFQRCFTVHETSGILVQNNVAYNTFGHCYFLENGGERFNVFDHNLGIRALPMASENPNQIIPSDVSPSIFWITNPNNTWTNNAAVGGRFAYWFSLPESPIGPAAAFYVNDNTVKPRYNPLGKFDGNVAHGAIRGLHIDDMLNPDGTTVSQLFCPRQGPFNQGGSLPYGYPAAPSAPFTNLVSYKNREFGVWGETCGLQFSGLKLLNNAQGILSNGISLVENSLIVGESANTGTPRAGKGLSRSYPDPWGSSTTQLIGLETYDNTGPQVTRNNVFENFVSTSTRPASGLANMPNGPFMLPPQHRLLNLTFQNANQFYLNYQQGDNQYGIAMMDLDGSVTGLPYGGWLVSNQTTMIKPSCTKRPEWNGYMCPPFPEGYVQVTVVDNLNSAPITDGYETPAKERTIRATFTQLDTRNLGSCQGAPENWQCPPGISSCYRYINTLMPKHQYGVNFVVNEHFVDTPSDLSIEMISSSPGDWIIVAVPYPTTAAPFDVEWRQYIDAPTATKMTTVDSVNDLSDNTYYYDSQNEFLYVRFFNTRTGGSDYEDIFGLTWYEGNAPDIRIKASCTKCTPKKTTPPAVALTPKEDLYQAELVTSTNTKMGIAFVTFNPQSVTATYSIYHKLSTTATLVGLYTSDGKLISTKNFVTSVSPVKGVFQFSRDQWSALTTNSLTVGVSTSQSKYLTGKLISQGTCTAPPIIPASDHCNTTATIQNIYNDTLLAPWSDYSWDITKDYNSVENRFCGSSSIKVTISNGALAFGIGSVSKYLAIDPVYQSLEFFIKLDKGYGETTLIVAFGDGSKNFADVTVQSQHIQNYVIDEFEWTLVRISLAEMKVVGQVVGSLTFHQNSGSQKVMFIDEIRLSSEAVSVPVPIPCKPVPTAPSSPDVLACSSTIMISMLAVALLLFL